MKNLFLFALLIYSAVILQRSAFSAWSLGIFQPQSLQIVVIAAFYLVSKEFLDELWVFLFAYFILWDLLGFSRFPGLNAGLFIFLIWLIQQLRKRFLRGSLSSLIALFIFISGSDYVLRNFPNLGFRSFLNQTLLNAAFYFIFYPFFSLVVRLMKSDIRSQLKLKI